MRVTNEIFKKLKKVKLLALDFDGTLTNGKVYVNQYGEETVCCSKKDSLGTNMLQKAGIQVVVLSKETNPVVKARCKKIRVSCYSGANTGNDKLKILKQFMLKNGITSKEVVFMGDDVNDLLCLEFAGIAATVADGNKACKKLAHIITKKSGGDHAVREVCDLILKAKKLPI
ncbi:MAG: HAD hydrolase family protein [Oligoflexia bacterium]|nr:HAD hydrolase family protein [Oligoflexia bacterium]